MECSLGPRRDFPMEPLRASTTRLSRSVTDPSDSAALRTSLQPSITAMLGCRRQSDANYTLGIGALHCPPTRSAGYGAIEAERRSHFISFRQNSLRHAVSSFLEHFHHESNHQRKGSLVLLPTR